MPLNAAWKPGKTIQSPDEFLDRLRELAARRTLVFRGQAKAEWRLQPSIDRHVPETSDYKDRLGEEAGLIAKFRGEAARFLGPLERQFVEGFPPEDKVVRMTVIQHFGGPTRLLDWTHSSLVAAYFACIEEWETDGAIWWFDSESLKKRFNDQWTKYGFSSPRNINYNERIFDPSVPSFVGIVYLKIPFPRAQAQRGLFTLVSRLGSRHDDVLPTLLSEGAYDGMIIPANLKRHVVEDLERMGVDAVSLQHAGADRCGLRMTWERSPCLAKQQSTAKQ